MDWSDRLSYAVQRALMDYRAKPIYVSIDDAWRTPGWSYNPNRRHLVFYGDPDIADVAAGVAAHVLSKSAYLGRGYISAIPERLKERAWPIRSWVIDLLSSPAVPGRKIRSRLGHA